VDRVIEEMKGYSDFSIHRVLICHYIVFSPILPTQKGFFGGRGGAGNLFGLVVLPFF